MDFEPGWAILAGLTGGAAMAGRSAGSTCIILNPHRMAVMAAAATQGAPVMVQTSEGAVTDVGFGNIA